MDRCIILLNLHIPPLRKSSQTNLGVDPICKRVWSRAVRCYNLLNGKLYDYSDSAGRRRLGTTGLGMAVINDYAANAN